MKRCFDIFLSLFGLIVFSPIFLVLSLIIVCDSKGGIFFKGERVGLNGKTFIIYKFRSMLKDCEDKGAWIVSDEDMRITRVGHFLRKTKIDELPQLINVLRGDMSFVGPRPEVKYFVDMYTEEQKKILSLKPGITDWASMTNFDQYKLLTNMKDPDRAYIKHIQPLKLKLQLYYFDNRSLFTYIKIILWTIFKVITRSQKLPKEIQRIKDECFDVYDRAV